MNLALDNAPIEVQSNFETWREVWQDRCEAIKVMDEGAYSRHILLVLPDLIEELEFNAGKLAKNQYAKRYFAHCLHEYFADRKHSSKESWLKNAHSELALVLESLSENSSEHILKPEHILPLVRGLDSNLQTFESFAAIKEMLLTLIMSGAPVDSKDEGMIFLVDTLILLFWRKGRFIDSIEGIPGVLLEEMHHIRHGNKFFPSFPTAPDKDSLSDEEYRRKLEDFYSTLSIKTRFDQLDNFYREESRQYEVIFRVTGIDLRSTSFTVGNVTVYDPRQQAHIKDDPNDPLARLFGKVETKDSPGLCISVLTKGLDRGLMRIEAKRQAERAVALLMTSNRRRKPIELQSHYAILDPDGHITSAGGPDAKFDNLWTDDLRDLTDKRRQRFGLWVTSARPHSTIRRWLTAIDWHRRSAEAVEANGELLDAWFSVEHLVDEDYKIPLRVPHFLSQRKEGQKGDSAWLPNPQMRLIQCIIAFDSIKRELDQFASKIAYGILFPFPIYPESHKLSKEVTGLFSDGDRSWSPRDFVNNIDRVIDELQAAKAVADIQDATRVKRMFFDPDYAMSIITYEFWRIKDDIYNIYRLRNMLVHSARTESFVLEYYAHRIHEYSFSLLETLKWKLLLTKSDDEILSLERYLSDIVLEGNLALEGVQRKDMTNLRHWIFSK